MNTSSLKGKVALVTGGGKGIGRETALLLARLGARVFICGRTKESLSSTVQLLRALGSQADYVVTDVRDPAQCMHLAHSIQESAGRLDIVINNAGMSMRGLIEEIDSSVIRAMVDINFLGAAYVTKFTTPMLKETQGSVVFISSLSALHGLPMVGPYGASKLALKGLSESLRAELYSFGVHVGLVHVGFTENDPDKLVYRQDGSLRILEDRKNSHTQEQVAKHIINNVLKRKRESTLTAIGQLAAFVYRFFPSLADWAIASFSGKSGRY